MPLNTDIDEHLHNFSLRKPYHRVAPSLLWGCSKDVPSFYQHSEWDERKTENIDLRQQVQVQPIRVRMSFAQKRKSATCDCS